MYEFVHMYILRHANRTFHKSWQKRLRRLHFCHLAQATFLESSATTPYVFTTMNFFSSVALMSTFNTVVEHINRENFLQDSQIPTSKTIFTSETPRG